MPSVVTTSVSKGCAGTPAPASVAVQSTEVSVRFQPAAFGAGLSVGVATGPVLSTT
jgi:hypothetical protein